MKNRQMVDPHFHKAKDVIISMTARQAQIIPAITPLLNSLALCGGNSGILSQSRVTRTLRGIDPSPCMISRLSIALRVPPRTTISYTVFIVKLGMIVCEPTIFPAVSHLEISKKHQPILRGYGFAPAVERLVIDNLHSIFITRARMQLSALPRRSLEYRIVLSADTV